MNGKRLGTLLLAGSLGLNVALGGVLIYQAVERERESSRFEYDRWRRGEDQRGRYDWQSRYRAEQDSTHPSPRLDEGQIRRLRDLRHEMEENILPLRREINTLQALMRHELAKQEPDIARLDSMVEETSRLQTSIQQQSLRLILKEREILTPEQFRSFIRMMMPGQMYTRDQGRYGGRGFSDRDTSNSPGRQSRNSLHSQEPPPPPPPPGGRFRR